MGRVKRQGSGKSAEEKKAADAARKRAARQKKKEDAAKYDATTGAQDESDHPKPKPKRKKQGSAKSTLEKKAAHAARQRETRLQKKIQAEAEARNRQQEIKEQESKLKSIKKSHPAFNSATAFECDDDDHDFPLNEIPKPLPETLALWNEWVDWKLSVMQDVDEEFRKFPVYRAPEHIPSFLKAKLRSNAHALCWKHMFLIVNKEFECEQNEVDKQLKAFWEDPHYQRISSPICDDTGEMEFYIERKWDDIIMEAAKEDGCSQEVKHLAYQVQYIRNRQTAALLRVWDAKQNDPHRGSAWLYDSIPDLSMWQEEEWDNWMIEEEREVLALVKQGHTKILPSWGLSAHQHRVFIEQVEIRANSDAMDTSSDSDSDDDEVDDRFRK